MQAITRRRYGGPEVVQVEELPVPDIAVDEVLIEVVAAGLDRGAWHLMKGTPYLIRLMFGIRAPREPRLGLDVAGRVVKVGKDVTRFVPGDEVFGIAKGSFAEFAAAKEAKLVPKPEQLSFAEAGVATVSGITALQALTTDGRLVAGQHVLVLGASGGVGSFCVQLAKALGGIVTGTASEQKLDFVRSLGAVRAVDYTTHQVDELGEQFDLIIDCGGANPIPRLRRALKERGALVIVGAEGAGRITGGLGRNFRAKLLSPFMKQRLTFTISVESLRYIEPLAEHLASGAVVAAVEHRFTLSETPEAFAQMDDGLLRGKAAILVRAE